MGQNNLGRMYDKGEGVAKDYKKATEWFRKAAEQGHAWGQYNLGNMYEKGDGVHKDLTTAYAWYTIAAANGYTLAVAWKANTAKQLTPAQITQAQALSRRLSSQIRTP